MFLTLVQAHHSLQPLMPLLKHSETQVGQRGCNELIIFLKKWSQPFPSLNPFAVQGDPEVLPIKRHFALETGLAWFLTMEVMVCQL